MMVRASAFSLSEMNGKLSEGLELRNDVIQVLLGSLSLLLSIN